MRGNGRWLAMMAAWCLLGFVTTGSRAETPQAGTMVEFAARSRVDVGNGVYKVLEKKQTWDGRKSAVIVIDMWDKHWCQSASARVEQLAPRMDAFLAAARKKGMLIIHAPSSCMEPYKDHPGRQRAIKARAVADPPKDIAQWCHRIDAEGKGKYPIDQSDGGCDCISTCKTGDPWRRQFKGLTITNEDAISDSGVEIWNLLAEQAIDQIMIVGVHTNMCVLGRPFGLRNLSRYGKKVVLVRDLTDTMYNPRSWPHVSHFEGTARIVEHIEKFVCPTVTSTILLGSPEFQFPEDKTPNFSELTR